LFKAGTKAELEKFKGMLPNEIFQEAFRVVAMLDETYGPDRDVENGDGGFVLIAETVQDIEHINRRHMKLDGNAQEAVDVVKCGDGFFINAFFLNNNEFGINVLMPVKIAPYALLND
jgi:hypothetical protein